MSSTHGINSGVKKIIDEITTSGITTSRGILSTIRKRKENGTLPVNVPLPKVILAQSHTTFISL